MKLFGLTVESTQQVESQLDEARAADEMRTELRIAAERVLTAAKCLGKRIDVTEDMVGGTGYMDVDPKVDVLSWGVDPHGRWVVYVPCCSYLAKNDQAAKEQGKVTLVVFKRYSEPASHSVAICKAPSHKTTVAGLDSNSNLLENLERVFEMVKSIDAGYYEHVENYANVAYRTLLARLETVEASGRHGSLDLNACVVLHRYQACGKRAHIQSETVETREISNDEMKARFPTLAQME